MLIIYIKKYVYVKFMKDLKEKQEEQRKFEKSLSKMSYEELEKLEQEIIAEADKNGEELGKLEFDMPSDNYATVAEAIRMFLDKQEIQWQYTLGMVAMYDFWDPKKRQDKIPYAHLDSILRTLGGLKFKGYDEWSAVVAVNKFFEPLQKAYVDATQETYDIAVKHDAVMKAMELVQTPKEKKAK